MSAETTNESLCEAVSNFLARKQHYLFINGKFTPARSNKTFETWNPSTGTSLAHLARGEAADIDDAVCAARRAFEGEWSRWSPYDRQKLLYKIHEELEQNFEELAQIESIDVGTPITRTRASQTTISRMILYFAAQCANIAGETLPNGLPGQVTTMSLKAPVGVVGGIIPWNAPLGGQWWIIGATLATGCTCVLKPAEDASLSVLRTAELLQEIGLPEGVVNVVTGFGGDAGDALARHHDVDRIAFTGSTITGRKIIEASAGNIKKLQLELGGKSPDIIFADADLNKAVPGAAMGVFANSGQICYAGTRVFVERSILDEFCARVADFMRTVRVGHSLDPSAQLGPLISRRQLERVMSYIDIGTQEGAHLQAGGVRLGGELETGFFVSPTLFSDVNNNMQIAQEEIFGPVLSVIPFDTMDEAITLGNQTQYGLGGAVWTRDIAKAFTVVQRIHSGVMWVNCYGLIDPLVGFGGIKMSGYGSKGGRAHLDTYLYPKTVYINTDL